MDLVHCFGFGYFLSGLVSSNLCLLLCYYRLELREEWRLINRSAFANIWSDMVFGISLFLILYFNQNQVCSLDVILIFVFLDSEFDINKSIVNSFPHKWITFLDE